jgi:DNA-binding beta-propeller fold protein YncE
MASGASAQPAHYNFESGHVRPIALSPDGARLYAVNTPDARLEVFATEGSALTHLASVPVGLEPVAVSVGPDGRPWVVNALSDSVSIVSTTHPPHVQETLWLGDFPQDVVFAGEGGRWAFVTTADRGQHPITHEPGTPALVSTGRARVWVFDATAPSSAGTREPVTVLRLFSDAPRALAVSADGARVYAAAFLSGNRTGTVSELGVCDGGASAEPCNIELVDLPGGLPLPDANFEGVPAPEAGLIVRYDPETGGWLDALGRDFGGAMKFSLPDEDVFVIDATQDPPAQIASFAGVGTALFGMAVHPTSGHVFVTNTEANNLVRTEPAVRGHLHEARITVLRDGGAHPVHLNPHIDYEVTPSGPGVAGISVSMPMGAAFAPSGETLYVAAFGSSKLVAYSAAALEAGTIDPASVPMLELPRQGPTGLAIRGDGSLAYVATRLDNSVHVVALPSLGLVASAALHSPEPAHVREGRRLFYDATHTSSNGESSCASCHVFGGDDGLAWDLGNPSRSVLDNPIPIAPRTDEIGRDIVNEFHPLKGPMSTQPLRGLRDGRPMHWRGDLNGGADDLDDDYLAFAGFNGAFVSLLGRSSGLPDDEFIALTEFTLSIVPGPNPYRPLDNELTTEQAASADFFFTTVGCDTCHAIDRERGRFGTSVQVSLPSASFGCGSTQPFLIPSLQETYRKLGRGVPTTGLISEDLGPQIRGFGFMHDGHRGTFPELLTMPFVMAMETHFAPIVGHQVTWTTSSDEATEQRRLLLFERASEPFVLPGGFDVMECDLVAHARMGDRVRGWLWDGSAFVPDRAADAPVTDVELRSLSSSEGAPVTYTCAPPGSGRRMAIDRDLDGTLDGDELLVEPLPRGTSGCGCDAARPGPEGLLWALLTLVIAQVRRRPAVRCRGSGR